MKKLSFTLKRILLSLALIGPALALPLHAAQAQSLGGIALGVTLGPFVNTLFIGIPYVVGYIGGLMLKVVSYVVNYLFYLNTEILPDKFGIIEIGYSISLSVANTILVIALIVIAFATILNVEEYTAKKKLGQVISTAVLINFGLLIVGVLLDLSHVITKFFLSGGEVGTSLGGALGPQRFLDFSIISNNKLQIAFGVFESGWFMIVGGVIMLAFFTWALFIVMSAVGGMFIWRYIKLVGLIIVLPFAWALALLPGGSEKKSKWWHDFIQAAFFMPGAAFFIYLAIRVAETISTKLADPAEAGRLGGDISWAQGMDKLPQFAMQLLVVIGILMYGLKTAQDMGGEIASKGMALGRKLSDRVVNKAERATRKMYGGVLNANNKSSFMGVPTGRLLNGAPGILGGKSIWGKDRSFKGAATATGAKIGAAGKWVATRTGKAGEFTNMALGGSAEDKNVLEALGGVIKGAGIDYSAYTKRFEEMDHEKYEAMLAKPPVENQAAMNALMKIATERGDLGDLAKGAAAKNVDAIALAAAYKSANPEAAHHPEKDSVLRSLALSDPKQSQRILGQDTTQFLRSLGGGDIEKLNKAKFAEFADKLTHGQLMAFGRKNGENEELVRNHLTEKVTKEATDTGNADFIKAAQDIQAKTTEMETIATKLKTEKDNFSHADHAGNKAEIDRTALEIEKLREQLDTSSRERNKLIRGINLTKTQKGQFPEFAYALQELTDAAKNIGGTGSREKAASSHHAHAPKSAFVDFIYEKGGGGGHGDSHGHGH